MQIGATYAGHRYAVPTPIVFERDVKRLMDISDSVAEKFQRCELLRLARAIRRQDLEVLPDRRHDAGRCTWAALGMEPVRVSRQVHEVLACPLPWVIRPRTGLAEGAEPFVGADQLIDLGACAGLG